MTLPGSGTMTAAMINVELGRASTAPFSIGGTEERELAGVPSGTISFSDFYGKSWITLSPVSGTYSTTGSVLVDYTITANRALVWTYTRTGTAGGSESVPSGGSASSITFTQTPITAGQQQVEGSGQWTVTATKNGVTVGNWVINITATP